MKQATRDTIAGIIRRERRDGYTVCHVHIGEANSPGTRYLTSDMAGGVYTTNRPRGYMGYSQPVPGLGKHQ